MKYGIPELLPWLKSCGVPAAGIQWVSQFTDPEEMYEAIQSPSWIGGILYYAGVIPAPSAVTGTTDDIRQAYPWHLVESYLEKTIDGWRARQSEQPVRETDFSPVAFCDVHGKVPDRVIIECFCSWKRWECAACYMVRTGLPEQAQRHEYHDNEEKLRLNAHAAGREDCSRCGHNLMRMKYECACGNGMGWACAHCYANGLGRKEILEIISRHRHQQCHIPRV